MKSVKVPKEIQEAFTEATACGLLAKAYRRWLLPSPKAYFYMLKSARFSTLGWKALMGVYPEVSEGVWTLDNVAGVAFRNEDPKPVVAKAPRKPRVKKEVQPAAPAAKQGETK